MFAKIKFSLPGLIPHLPFRFLFPKHFSGYPTLVFSYYVHSCFGLKELGVEEDQNWLDKPIEERNLSKDQRGWLLFYAHLREHWNGRYGLRDCVAVKGILPCVGCVGTVEAKLDRSCRGVHSSVVELTSLAIPPFHCLSSLINPTVDWHG